MPEVGGGPRLAYLIPFIALGLALGAVIVAWSPQDELVDQPVLAPTAPPLALDGFSAGNLISDEEFFDPNTMSEADVSEFISTWNDGCQSGPDGTECLSVYREDTPTWPADRYCPSDFIGESEDSAASIITKVSHACEINPRVLITTLQKEQGLVTASGPRLLAKRYDIAMGYGCPDGTDCDPQYFGFARQMYFAARQFQKYRLQPELYDVKAQATNTVAYHVNPECGSSEVYVENQATAGLYNYTPYQPNDSALRGFVDECATWGNMNFYGLYHAWFPANVPTSEN
ncbi:MAG: hemagglutinin [Actinomycetaceae bacterium]|nr:hemagglutinin [Actinomycetaceae bacterium]